MYCNNCGKEVQQLEKFCPHCGHPLNVVITDSIAQKASSSPFAVASIATSIVGSLLFPIAFAPIAIILGAVAKSKDERRATVALILAGICMVWGIIHIMTIGNNF